MANCIENDLKETVFDDVDGKVPGCCEVGNEPSSSIQCTEVLEYPNDLPASQKDSTPWI
jgi:hypothetical protein